MTWIIFSFVVFAIMMLFLHDVARPFVKRMSASSKKLAWYAFMVAVGATLSGLIGSIGPESSKALICLGSFGMICLMMLFITSLALVSLIPQKMEEESNGKDND